MLILYMFPVPSHPLARCPLPSPPEMRQMALRSPVSVSSISMGNSWLAKVNTKSVSGPKPALCICVRLRVSPSEKVMVSWSGVYLVQIRRICQMGENSSELYHPTCHQVLTSVCYRLRSTEPPFSFSFSCLHVLARSAAPKWPET